MAAWDCIRSIYPSAETDYEEALVDIAQRVMRELVVWSKKSQFDGFKGVSIAAYHRLLFYYRICFTPI
jgi:hypothetical protein